jgi:hypothetical protein
MVSIYSPAISGIHLSVSTGWAFLWQVFVKSSFVETKGGHGINEKVLSKRSDTNKTPRNVVTEGTAPFGRSAASHRRKTEVALLTSKATVCNQNPVYRESIW